MQWCRHRASFIVAVAFITSGTITLLEYSINGDIPIFGTATEVVGNHCSLQCIRCNDSSHLQAKSKIISAGDLDDLFAKKFHDCVATKWALLMAKDQQQPEKKCHKNLNFLNRTSPIVALVSFPGSGNSWVRHLLEQATGVYTGSIYCDTTLKAYFPGEYIVSGNVVAVKTHHSDSVDLPIYVQTHTGKKKFDQAILIVRDPYDALIAEANRRWTSVHKAERHLGLAKKSSFIGSPKWNWFVEYKGFSWFMMLNTWLKDSNIPVLTVQYEKLKLNISREVKRMTDFIRMPVSEEVLNCVSANSQGHFRRVNHLDFDPYSKGLKVIVNHIIGRGNSILKDYDIHYEPR